MGCALQAQALIVMDANSRSRGYGTIEFATKADAAAAIKVCCCRLSATYASHGVPTVPTKRRKV